MDLHTCNARTVRHRHGITFLGVRHATHTKGEGVPAASPNSLRLYLRPCGLTYGDQIWYNTCGDGRVLTGGACTLFIWRLSSLLSIFGTSYTSAHKVWQQPDFALVIELDVRKVFTGSTTPLTLDNFCETDADTRYVVVLANLLDSWQTLFIITVTDVSNRGRFSGVLPTEGTMPHNIGWLVARPALFIC